MSEEDSLGEHMDEVVRMEEGREGKSTQARWILFSLWNLRRIRLAVAWEEAAKRDLYNETNIWDKHCEEGWDREPPRDEEKVSLK